MDKIPWAVLAVTFVLTFATRLLFEYMNGVPLTVGGTSVVAGFWLLLCLLCRWLLSRTRTKHGEVRG